MKITLDLPNSLVKEMRFRASREGRKLKDLIAELLRAGLDAPNRPAAPPGQLVSPRIVTDPKTGLPSFVCAPDAPASRMTAEDLLAFEQATQTQEDRQRLGLSD